MYVNKTTGARISSDTYYRLLPSEKAHWIYESPSSSSSSKRSSSNDGFIESAVIGAVTDSAIVGTLLGGNIAGAILGDIFNGGNLMD